MAELLRSHPASGEDIPEFYGANEVEHYKALRIGPITSEMSARRTYGSEKVDLGLLLAAIAARGAVRPGELVTTAARYFNCSERTVRDAIAVLRRSGYVDIEKDDDDLRRRQLMATERGVRLASNPFGWAILRLARRLFTTCASPGVGTFQAGLAYAERHERLAYAEAILVKPGRA